MKNVLFILTDDQRYNTIHALGNQDIITPNLDRLVENGTAFTQAHIPCGTSGAVCMPSRAMLNTGRTLFHIWGEGQTIDANHTTMGQAFRENGYETFGCGKWHNGIPGYQKSFSKGANIFFGGMWDHWNVPLCDYDVEGKYDNTINFIVDFFQNKQITPIHCDHFSKGKHSTELLTDTVCDFLQTREKEKPFFSYLAYLAPHDPRTMPQKYIDMYDIDKITLPGNYMTEHPFKFGVENIRDETLAAQPRNEREIKQHLLEYYAMITHLDDEIGRIIQTLRETGELDNTLIVVTGDNGLAVGSHSLMGKQNHYDHSVRVPLIFSGPGIPKNQKADGFVYLLDIFPTLCELCDIEIPETVEGKSFARMLDDPSCETRDTLYFAYNQLLRSVKDRRYKLIEYRNGANRTQLFDLVSDPDEMNDLFGKPEYADIVSRLRSTLLAYKESWEDTGHKFTGEFWNNY